MASPFTAPSRAKLLPDWPLDYLQPPIPADTPCPHTLVLDMEDTLICSTWDRRYGWRHAKRPGADEFLKELSRYYEIVLFTTNMVGIGDPVMSLLDPQGLAMHRLHRDATRFVNGHHVKDLSRLNRNVKKIVLVDDDAHAAMLQPANLIRVAPYSDARDKSDKQLLELIPFLTSIVKEGVDDVPKLLSSYGSHDASSILRSYRAQVDAIRQGQDAVRAKGIGGFVRKRAKAPDAPPPPKVRSTLMSSKDIVGDDAEVPDLAAARPKGALWRAFDEYQQNLVEEQRVKQEACIRAMEAKAQQRQAQ